MKAPPNVHRRLLIEALETRTLLAADLADPYGLVADFNLAMHAVSGTGDFQASFSTNFGNHQLVLTGSTTGSLTINLDQLPAFITNLSISSFGNVQITGTDHVDNLILAGIGSVAAPNLSVSQASFASNVGSLSVASLGTNAVFSGSDMKLTAASLEGTTIYSDLHSLTLTSESKVVQFVALGTNYEQTLNLTYLPEILATSGITKTSIHVVLQSSNNDASTPITPPVDNQPPTTPVDTSDLGNGTTIPSTTTPSTDTDHLVIVSLPVDEATRQFLNQLRDLLHSSQADAQQRVLDLVNHTSLPAGYSVNPAVAAGFAGLDAALPLSSDFLNGGSANLAGLALGQAISDGAALVPPGEHFFDGTSGRFVPQSINAEVLSPREGFFLNGVVNVDVSWPVTLAAGAPVLSRSATARRSDDGELLPKTLAQSVSALGSYIVERFTAEFSPGQQSLVLLVDPQPSRNAAANRKASASRLLSPLEISIPDEHTAAA